MDVLLPDGTLIKGVPDGMSKADLTAKLARNGYDVSKLATPAPAAPTPAGPSAGYQQGQADEGWKQGLMSVAQGPTFGFADELAGAIGAPFGGGSVGENYQRIRDRWRGAADAQEKENPWTTGITRGMAAAPTMLVGKLAGLFKGAQALPAAAQAAPGLLMRTAQAGAAGAGFGTAAGLGSSTTTTPEGMAEDAAAGGATGAVFGAAMTPVAAAGGAAWKAGTSAISDTAAGKYAKQKVAEAFARDKRGNGLSDDALAWLKQTLTRYNKLGGEATVADAGGQNTRALLDVQATLPGKTKQAVETMIHDRQAGRGARLRSSAETELNPSGLRLQETIDDLVKRRAEAAAPLYADLHLQTIRATDDLHSIVAAAEKLGAGKTAQTISTGRQVAYTLGDREAKTMAMRDLDHLKQGLDDLVSGNTDSMTGRTNNVGAAVMSLKERLIKELDATTGGAYKAARDAYAGPSALIDAANLGRKFLSMDDQVIAKNVSRMADSEVEAFKLGAYEALRNKLGRQAGQTEILNMWKEPATQERLKALFGDERGYRLFAASVAKEGRLKALEGVGRGSQTAARQYGAGDLDVSAVGNAVGAANDVVHGNVPGLLARGGQAWNRVKTPEPVRDAIGRILLSKGQQGRTEINALQKIMQDVSDARMAETLGLGVYGSQAGAPVANALMR